MENHGRFDRGENWLNSWRGTTKREKKRERESSAKYSIIFAFPLPGARKSRREWLKQNCRAGSSPTGNISTGNVEECDPGWRVVTIESEPVNLASARERTESCQAGRCPHAACLSGPKFFQNSANCATTRTYVTFNPTFWNAFNSGRDPSPRPPPLNIEIHACFNDRGREQIAYFGLIITIKSFG